jgi:hypothetical protein
MNIDHLSIWGYSTSRLPEYSDLDRIGEASVLSLSRYLQEEIVIVEQHLVRHDGLVLSIRKQVHSDRPLSLYWEGKLMFSISKDIPKLNAELFLFIDQRRLCRTGDDVGSLLMLSGSPSDSGEVQWSMSGLFPDEFKEWSYITAPQWANMSEVRRTLD